MLEYISSSEIGSSLEARTITLSFVPIDAISKPLFIGLVFSSLFPLVLSWIAVSLRFYTRVILVPIAGWDDWTALISLIMYTAFEVCVLVIVYSITPHASLLSAHLMTLATNLMIAAECLYIWCMMVVKISLGIFFLRIVTERWQKRVIYVMVSLSFVVGLAYFGYAIFQCGVPNNNGIEEWETRISNECGSSPADVEGASYTHGVINMLTDISLLLVPIPTLRAARIAPREKVIVIGILTIAICGCAASAARLGFISSLYNVTESFWVQISYLVITASIECGMSITASSAATLRPLLRKIHSWLNSNASSFRFNLSDGKKSSQSSRGFASSMEKSSGTSQPNSNNGPSVTDKTDPITTTSTMAHVNPTFFLDTVNTMASDSQEDSHQHSTFFLQTMQSMDRATGRDDSGEFGINDLDSLVPYPPDVALKKGQDDLEDGGKRRSRANRATWWPLPGSRVLDDEE